MILWDAKLQTGRISWPWAVAMHDDRKSLHTLALEDILQSLLASDGRIKPSGNRYWQAMVCLAL
jgi:hypothetical protein